MPHRSSVSSRVGFRSETTIGNVAETNGSAPIKREGDMENISNMKEEVELDGRPSSEHLLITVAGRYTAYAIDLGFLWRWEIYIEEDVMVQDGGSISLSSATEAVNHVLAFFSARDQNTICGDGLSAG